MNSTRKRLGIVLILALVISSFGLFGADAATGTKAKKAPPALKEFKVHSGYKSVILAWRREPKADGYVIYYKRPDNKYYQYRVVGNPKQSIITYKVSPLNMYKDYAFRVATYVKDPTAKNGRRESATVMSHAEPVREMTYALKIASSGTLDSHYGKKASYRVNRGETIIANKFTVGQYVFEHNGSMFHISKTRVRYVEPIYTRSWNYGKFTAENFVNDRGVTSETNRLIWISTYTQHAYYFTGSKGKWKMVDHWECSTGKPTAPTPTGYNNNKKIWKKVATRHNHRWWSPFSSMNSIHGGYDPSMIGTPRSSGCVGNYDKDAKKVYDGAGLGTTVIIF